MPVNLNALLRYKTIDDCLSNKQVNCTIDYLIEKCSEKLYEATGVKKGVSERTIRNDIRILKSDILGFNAPIIIKKGVYSYSDIEFSIFNQAIKNLELLIDIQDLLTEEFDSIKNKNLPYLLKTLSSITNKEVPEKLLPPKPTHRKDGVFEKKRKNIYLSKLGDYMWRLKPRKKTYFFKTKQKELFNWQFIYELI